MAPRSTEGFHVYVMCGSLVRTRDHKLLKSLKRVFPNQLCISERLICNGTPAPAQRLTQLIFFFFYWDRCQKAGWYPPIIVCWKESRGATVPRRFSQAKYSHIRMSRWSQNNMKSEKNTLCIISCALRSTENRQAVGSQMFIDMSRPSLPSRIHYSNSWD